MEPRYYNFLRMCGSLYLRTQSENARQAFEEAATALKVESKTLCYTLECVAEDDTRNSCGMFGQTDRQIDREEKR